MTQVTVTYYNALGGRYIHTDFDMYKYVYEIVKISSKTGQQIYFGGSGTKGCEVTTLANYD